MRTERLRLAPATVADAEAQFAIMSDEAGWWYDPSGRHLHLDQTRDWLTRAAARWDTDGLSYWTVRLDATGEVIGAGGVQRRQDGHWNLFYRLATAHQGHGYATELARAAIAAAHEHDDSVAVEAWIAEANGPSRKVAERLGFTDYGAAVDASDGQVRLLYADRPPV